VCRSLTTADGVADLHPSVEDERIGFAPDVVAGVEVGHPQRKRPRRVAEGGGSV